MTLIELLVVMVILPLVVGAIATVIIASLKNDTGISTRLSDSHDAQITSAYFVRDVQSTGVLTTRSSPTWCGSGTQVLGLQWQRNTGSTAIVSYVIGSIGSAPALKRNYCSGSTNTVSTLAHDLASSSAVTVTLTCNPGYLTSPSCKTDASGGPTAAREVATVGIAATEKSGFVFNLTAAPRQVIAPFGTTPPGGSAPPLLLLGSGTDINCAGSGHGTMTLNGIGVVNSSQSGVATFGPNYYMTGAQVYSGSSSPAQPPGNYITTSSTPTQMGPPLPDPYANLPDPSTSGMAVYTATNSLPGPGVYTNTVTITTAVTVSPGIYIFENGFATGGNPSANITGTGVLFFIGVPNAPPGTTQTAAYSVTGNSTVNLTAMTSGTYAGVVIFQSRTDSSPLQIAGNGGSATYGGVIYAPDASVDTSGNGTTSSSSVIANTLTCGGNGAVTIGSQIATTTAVSASPSNPKSGQSVTLTATVVGSNGLSPLGTVAFTDTPKGSSTPTTLCSSATLINGTATCPATLSASGSPYSIKASYGGNTNFQSSNGTTSLYVSVSTTTVVAAAPSAPSTGAPVTLTATVGPTPDSGSVNWSISYGTGGTVTCDTTTALSGGQATCTINSGKLQAAYSPYTVTATYGGDPSFAPSTGTLSLPVTKAGTTTVAKPSTTSVPVGSPLSDAASVTGTGPAPGGQVQFYVCQGSSGCTSAGSIWSDTETVSGGTAISSGYSPSTAGSYCFAAYYGGDANYATSSDTTTDQCFTVTQAGSVTEANPSTTTVAVGSAVTDAATVTGPGATPSGQVQFFVCQGTAACNSTGSIWSDTETLSGGSTTSAQFVPSNAGSYCFAAFYNGDSNYTASSDISDQCFTAS